MSVEDKSHITRLLHEIGDRPAAAEELLSLVYDQLRQMAGARMRQERPDHTLQPTILVHEAFLRLVGNDQVSWTERGHFFRLAAEAMRRILIDHARKRGRQKRGGARHRLPLDVIDLASEADVQSVLAFEDALRAFEGEDPRAAEVVKLRFFTGLSVEDTARVLGVSPRTTLRESAYARARLVQLLNGDES